VPNLSGSLFGNAAVDMKQVFLSRAMSKSPHRETALIGQTEQLNHLAASKTHRDKEMPFVLFGRQSIQNF